MFFNLPVTGITLVKDFPLPVSLEIFIHLILRMLQFYAEFSFLSILLLIQLPLEIASFHRKLAAPLARRIQSSSFCSLLRKKISDPENKNLLLLSRQHMSFPECFFFPFTWEIFQFPFFRIFINSILVVSPYIHVHTH